MINDPYHTYQKYLSANGPMIHQMGNQIISNLINSQAASKNKHEHPQIISQNSSKISQYQ